MGEHGHSPRIVTAARNAHGDKCGGYVIQIAASKSSRHTEMCEAAQALINGGNLRAKAEVVDYCRQVTDKMGRRDPATMRHATLLGSQEV